MDPRKKPPASDPSIRKGPLGDPTEDAPARRDPVPRGPDGEPKRIDDPKPGDRPDEIEAE